MSVSLNLHNGFARAEATITLFNVPNATSTQALVVNSSGTIAGIYSGGDCSGFCAFVRSPKGKITTFSPDQSNVFAIAGINSSGEVVGTSYTSGFVRSPDGTITDIGISPNDVNDAGYITGILLDENNNVHGALLAPDGTLTTFDVESGASTYPISINSKGEITGYYYDAKSVYHGFLRDQAGKIKAFDPPKSHTTYALAIDERGKVVGTYSEKLYGFYGFLRTLKVNLSKSPSRGHTKPKFQLSRL